MPNQSIQLARVFQGMADPTRIAVLERLSRGPASVTELARPFRMALPSFTQHLQVLERCKLVRSRKSGRTRTYQLTAPQMKLAQDWLERQRNTWETQLNQLDNYLMQLKEKS